MKSSQKFAVATLIVSLIMTAGACSGSDESVTQWHRTSSTWSAPTTSGVDDPATPVETDLSDAEFAAEIGKISDALETAGTDPCKQPAAQDMKIPFPTNPKQVAWVVDIYAQRLRAMAGSLPESAAGAAEGLRKSADKIERAAKAAGYSQEFMSSDWLVDVLNSSGVSDGVSAFTNAATDCPG